MTSSSKYSTCQFCGVDKEELYTCPRCSKPYCTLRCYKSEKHQECSEKFYEEHVKRELTGKKFDASQQSDECRDKMERFLNGDWSGINIDEGEPLDSDDDGEDEEKTNSEEVEAMRKTIKATIDDYELDEAEIERRMITMGLSDDVEQLLNTLTKEEREAFKQLANEMQIEEEGLGQSVFH